MFPHLFPQLPQNHPKKPKMGKHLAISYPLPHTPNAQLHVSPPTPNRSKTTGNVAFYLHFPSLWSVIRLGLH